ncbi:IS110 family transposase [Dyadobacter sp. CY323]|uniref:IS110 family transposase n=1 Tax=Dyadobacter sp. CY323 TaxID=2907302 RepID=UPI001F453529|nr:IS110 family transposase [Dyadobacter sp. CY323]MCE6989815.1 IS110 family transposase [Dyadobacter sp. CY323]
MERKSLPLRVVNFNAAGIDVGSRSHLVAVDQNKDNVRTFGIYTKDHEELIKHLQNHGISSVAMESTGSYWQTLFNALQKAGFTVLLVGGSQTKNVQGRKTDVIDCIWIQKLHSLGLLSGSFLLSDALQELRTYYYHRQHLIEQISKYTHKMQKSLRLMNIRLDVAIRDITGKSGLAIIDAILSGSRDPQYLASLADIRMKKSKQEIADSLQGWWRDELLFELSAAREFYKLYEKALVACDSVIESALQKSAPSDSDSLPGSEMKNINKQKSKNAPDFNVSFLARQYFKTDLFAISGISYSTVLCLLTTMGNDIHKFPSGKSFASWLRLVPNNKVSGGRIISSRTPSGKSYLASALRQAANSIGNQKNHELSPFFKRIAYKKGRITAITATARKLAVIIWNMITKRTPYKKDQVKETDQKSKSVVLRQVERRIDALKLSHDELKALFTRASLLTS